MEKLAIICLAFLFILEPVNAQNFDWVTHIPGLSEELSRDIAVGPSGNAYVCGTFGNTMILPSGSFTSEGFRDGFLFKFDDQGKLLWHALMSSTFNEEPIAIAVDSQEQIYLLIETGDTLNIQGQSITGMSVPYLVLKFDSTGQYLSSFEPLTSLNAPGLSFSGIEVSPNGRISLAGSFGVFTSNVQSIEIGSQTLFLPTNPNNGFSLPQGFSAQYRPDGTVLWAGLTNGRGPASINHLGATADGGMVICGFFQPASFGVNPDFDFGPGTPALSTDFGRAGFVARFDSSGNVLWAQALQPGQAVASQFTEATAQRLAVDPSGAVYLYGEYVETVRWGNDSVNAFPPPFFGSVMPYGYVAKASPTGTPLWINGVSFADRGNASVEAMTADSATVFLGGQYNDTLLIGGLGLFGGQSDIWFASLDGSNGQGNYIDAVNAPGFPDEVNGLAVRQNGRLFVTGTVEPPASFGPFPITHPANSCCSNFFMAGYGVGCNGPSADFRADSAGVYRMTFLNQSSSTGPVTYQWDFGDGNTSIATNPAHTFPAPGSYAVCLIASDSCGVDTFCQNVFVPCQGSDRAVADFAFDNDTTNLTIELINNSVNAVQVFWDFGDGNTSNLREPTHQYAQPAAYQLCLIVSNLCNSDTLCQAVVADCDTSEASFTFVSDTTNLTVTFTDQSTNIEQYFWDYGDGNTDTVASPVHQYDLPGTYMVTLLAFGPCDTDTLRQQIVADCDTSEASFTFVSDTTNLTVTFTDQSTNIEQYFWDYGDGNTDTVASPVHQYDLPGTYMVTLLAFGPCDTDTLRQQIEADCDTSEASFTFVNDTTNLTVTFTDQSTNIEQYFWDFGDGNTDTVASPVHQYDLPGTYTVTLLAFGPCDTDTLRQQILADCDTTAIGFVVDDISPAGVATIINTTVNADQYFWSFGDGSTSTDINPMHQYDPGSYTLCLIAFGPCDIDTLCETIEILPTSLENPGELAFQIYPNPARDRLSIRWEGRLPRNYMVEYYDALGRRMGRKALDAGQQKPLTLSLADLPVGSYLLRITSSHAQQTMRFQKLE